VELPLLFRSSRYYIVYFRPLSVCKCRTGHTRVSATEVLLSSCNLVVVVQPSSETLKQLLIVSVARCLPSFVSEGTTRGTILH